MRSQSPSVQDPPAALPPGARLLWLDDRLAFEARLAGEPTPLAAYALAPHVIWRTLLTYWWIELAGHLCLFAESPGGCFLALPPLGPSHAADHHRCHTEDACVSAWQESFALMRQRNGGSMVSRVENVPEELVPVVQELGFVTRPKDSDYLYRRSDLVALRGDRYKSQRAAFNRFIRTARPFRYDVYREEDRTGCLQLFQDWRMQRLAGLQACGDGANELARRLIEDAAPAHAAILDLWSPLGLVGRVVRVDGRVRAYTFGYPRNAQVFCVLVEIADRSIPALAAYIFREFCREATGYTYVNTMDDSCLVTLARSKHGYHPDRMVANYIATEAE